MLLLVDAGNTRLKWNIMSPDTGELCNSTQSYQWPEIKAPAFFNEKWRHNADITGVMVSNVVGPKFAKALKDWVLANWLITAEFVVTTKSVFGVTCGYTNPSQLGVDRWVSMLAAKALLPNGAVCVIDCGTAVTIDTISAQGKHMGGLIAPGLDIMRDGLIKNIKGMSAHSMKPKVSLFGKDTQSGVDSGSVYAVVATIDRIADEIRKRIPSRVKFILTGGTASLIKPLLRGKYQHEPDLVLLGLGRIAGAFS